MHRNDVKCKWKIPKRAVTRTKQGRRFRSNGSAIVEGTVALMLLVPLIVGGVLLIIFTSACLLYQQKINFAAQSGALYAAESVAAGSYFLGVPKPGASSPAAVMAANAGQIQTAVQQTLKALGVPGGASMPVTSSVISPGGVTMAQVQVNVASFAIPGMPANVPNFPGVPVSAAAPFSAITETPPALFHLICFAPGNAMMGAGPWPVADCVIPVYAAQHSGGLLSASAVGPPGAGTSIPIVGQFVFGGHSTNGQNARAPDWVASVAGGATGTQSSPAVQDGIGYYDH